MSKLTRNVVWFLEPERPNCKIVRGVASLWNIELTRQLLTYFSVPGNLVISVVFRVLQKSQWQTCRSCAKSSCKWFSSLLLEESRVRFEWRSCHLFMKNLFYRLVPRRDTPNAAQQRKLELASAIMCLVVHRVHLTPFHTQQRFCQWDKASEPTTNLRAEGTQPSLGLVYYP